MVSKFDHPLVQGHQGGANALDLLVREIALLDPADGLPLHQLPDELDDGQHQPGQSPLHGAAINVDPWLHRPGLVHAIRPGTRGFTRRIAVVSGGAHGGTPSSPPGSRPSGRTDERTDETRARKETYTRSTSAMERVTSPVTTTPVASSRSRRSTRATCCGRATVAVPFAGAAVMSGAPSAQRQPARIRPAQRRPARRRS